MENEKEGSADYSFPRFLSFLSSEKHTLRILTGIILALIAILGVWLGGWFFFALVEVFIVFTLYELFSLFHIRGYLQYPLGTTLLASLFIPFYILFPISLDENLFLFLFIFSLLSLIQGNIRRGFTNLTYSIFGLLYVPFLGSFIFPIKDLGAIYVYYLFASVWAYDTFAYYSGSILGRTHLWRRLSPKKTLEGIVGGIIGVSTVTIIAWGFLHFSLKVFPITVIFISLSAQSGDFLESLIKRELGVKNSSNLLFSHGGFLDRVDSMLFAIPVFYLILRYLA